MTLTVALNPGMVKYHKKFRSCDGNGSSEPGYDEIPQKVQVTVTVTVALNPGMMKYHKKFRSLTVTVALNPGMMKYHKKFRSL